MEYTHRIYVCSTTWYTHIYDVKIHKTINYKRAYSDIGYIYTICIHRYTCIGYIHAIVHTFSIGKLKEYL
jgi:hypothetical protein